MSDNDRIDPHAVRTSLLLLVGPAVFLVHFATIYSFNALSCARGIAPGAVPLFVLAATVVGSVLVLLVPLAERRSEHGRAVGGHSDRAMVDPPARRAFVGHLAARVALLALGAMWLVALPTLFAQPC